MIKTTPESGKIYWFRTGNIITRGTYTGEADKFIFDSFLFRTLPSNDYLSSDGEFSINKKNIFYTEEEAVQDFEEKFKDRTYFVADRPKKITVF